MFAGGGMLLFVLHGVAEYKLFWNKALLAIPVYFFVYQKSLFILENVVMAKCGGIIREKII